MLRRFILTAALAFAASAASFAGTNVFTATGPSGGVAYDVEFTTGGALLATTSRGVYRSTDNGANWTRTLQTPTWFPMRLAVNPANRNVALSGTSVLKRSTDGGQTWTDVQNLAPLATNPASVVEFSADGSLAWLSQQNGGNLFRSTDGGATWTLNSTTGITDSIIWIDVDAVNPQLLYATTPNGGYRSIDGGQTFTKLTVAPYVFAAAASRVRGGSVIVTSGDDHPWYSSDGGITWTSRGSRTMYFVQYFPGSADRALAMTTDYHLLRTADSGATWQDLGPVPNGRIWGMAFEPAAPDHVVITGDGGIFVSADGGTSWAERNTGLKEANVHQAVVGRAGNGAVYFLTGDLASVYRRDPASGSWEARAASSTPLLGYSAARISTFGYYALAVAPQDSGLLYMARDLHFGVSNDAGATWTALPDTPIYSDAVTISPTDSRVVYLAARNAWPMRSTDGGATWNDLSSAGLPVTARNFAFDPTNPSIVYAAVDNYLPPAASPVYKSTNGGVSFTPTPWNVADNASIIWRLAHDPVRANIIYLSSYIGVFKSTDGGNTWTRSPLFASGQTSAGATDLVIDPQSPNVLYASSYQRDQIARSVDGGTNWDIFAADNELNGFNSLALVPGTRTKVIAARHNGAVEIEIAPNLAVTSVSPSSVVGTAASTILTLTNGSDFAASGVHLTATLPATSTTATVQGGGIACVLTGANLDCDVGRLAGHGNANVTVGYTPTTAGSWTATATAYEPDESALNNTTTITIAAAGNGGGNNGGGGGGGGGALDYLLLACLAVIICGRRLRSC